MPDVPPTHLASTERSTATDVRRAADMLADGVLQPELLDAIPQLVMVLDPNRQIVHVNGTLLEALGLAAASDLLGRRPGEALGCVNAARHPGGCGTSEACTPCGALLATLESLGGERSMHECRMRRGGNAGPLDLRVVASPLETPRGRFCFLVAQDISDEKRREALERIFFHDLLNTGGGISGCLDLICCGDLADGERRELEEMAHQLSHQLVEEIQTQRALSQMERDELEILLEEVDPQASLQAVRDRFARDPLAAGITLALDRAPSNSTLVTDRILLGRILTNMTKNALEASAPGDTITLGWDDEAGALRFRVHNPAVMPREVQLQVFQRSFSTKGPGRGIGTYSMKLLGERYLLGEVDVDSAEPRGTTFSLRLPLDARDADARPATPAV